MFVASNALSYLAVTNIAVNKCANKEALKAHLPFVIIVAGVMGIITRQVMFYIDYLLPYGNIDLKNTWTTFPPHHIFLSIFVGLVVIFATIFMDVLTQDGPRMLKICRNMNVLSLSRFSKAKIKSVDTHEEYYERLLKLHNKYCNITKVTKSDDKIGVCVTTDPSKEDFDEFDVIDKYYMNKFEPDLTAFLAAIQKFETSESSKNENPFEIHNNYIDSNEHTENYSKFNWLKSTGVTVMKKIPPEDVNRYDAYNSQNCELIRFLGDLKGKMADHKDKSRFFDEVDTGTNFNNFREALNEQINKIKNKYRQKATRDVILKLSSSSDQTNELVKILSFYIYAYSDDDIKYKTMLLSQTQIDDMVDNINKRNGFQTKIRESNTKISSYELSKKSLSESKKSTADIDLSISDEKKVLEQNKQQLDEIIKTIAAHESLKNPSDASTRLDVVVKRINEYIRLKKTGTVTGVSHFDKEIFSTYGKDIKDGVNTVRCDDTALTDEKFKTATFVLSTSGQKYYRNLGPYYYKTNLDNIKKYRTRLANLFSGILRKKVVTNYSSCEDDYLRQNIINGYTWIMIMWPSVELYSAIANVKTALFKDNQNMTFVFMGASVILPTLYGVFLYGGAGIAQGSSVFKNLLFSSKEIVQKVVKVNTEIGSYTFDIKDETKVDDIKKGLDEKEEGIFWTDYGLFYNDIPLNDMTKTLKSLNIEYGSTLSLRKTTVIEEPSSAAAAGTSAAGT
jgi:hypothetical protein